MFLTWFIFINSEEPFSGLIINKYESGQKHTKGYLTNGREDGIWTWWYENGQKSKEVDYFDGKTLDVYSKPENLTSARVFSDPPMNIAEINKSGEKFKINNNNVEWKSNLKIKDGKYKIGIRPHNITTYKEGNNSVEINGKVLISELSGSESLIHFTNGKLNWVSLSNGIQSKNIGEETKLYMNIDEFLYFDQNNRLVNHG